MTFQDISTMVNSMGFPYNYLQFEENSAPALPYVLFYYPQRDDVIADNKNYALKTALNIELCTEEKDFEAEATVEAILIANEIPFTKTETYIDTEKMYLILYEMEVFLSAYDSEQG